MQQVNKLKYELKKRSRTSVTNLPNFCRCLSEVHDSPKLKTYLIILVHIIVQYHLMHNFKYCFLSYNLHKKNYIHTQTNINNNRNESETSVLLSVLWRYTVCGMRRCEGIRNCPHENSHGEMKRINAKFTLKSRFCDMWKHEIIQYPKSGIRTVVYIGLNLNNYIQYNR